LIKKKLKKIYYNHKKSKIIALIIGESTGVDCLKLLIEEKNVSISYVICSDKKYENLVKILCKKNNIRFFSKKLIINNFFKLENISKKSDLLLSVYSNVILNKKYLKFFKFRCFNIHPGILPYYPGKNCVSGSIFNQEKNIGSTIHLITTKIDGGNIVLQKKVSLNKNDSLLNAMIKLRNSTKLALKEFIKFKLNKNKINFFENDFNKIKMFPKYIPNDGKFNENWNLDFFKRMFRAGDSGPFKSEWGRINFFYKKQKKGIMQIISIKKNKKKQKILKVSKKKFQIYITNYKILVEAF
jgi:methionyl-tRNA formyltransferase